MIETDAYSGAVTVELLDEVRAETADCGTILEEITDHGPGFYAT